MRHKSAPVLLLLVLVAVIYLPLNIRKETTIPRATDFLIRYPRSGRPALLVPNMTVTIQVNSSYSTATGWSVSIIGVESANTYNLPITNVISWSAGTRYIFNITVTIGSEVNPELYNLTVSADISGTPYIAKEPRAIAVYASFPDTFNFTVINDFRFTTGDTTPEDAFRQAAKVINLLRPAFVVVMGDLVYSGFNETESDTALEYASFYNALQEFVVPTFVFPGNHEYYNNGVNYYDRYFYWHYYSWSFGDAYFIAFDTGEGSRADGSPPPTISLEQRTFAENNVNESAKLKVAFLHVPPYADDGVHELEAGSQTWFDNFVSSHSFNMVFAGHTHVDREYDGNGIPYVETTSLGTTARDNDDPSYTPYWGFRMVCVKDWNITHYYYKIEIGNNAYPRSEPLYLDSPGGTGTASITSTVSFTGTTSYANDGTETHVEAVLTNNLPQGTYRLTYVFHVPALSAGQYYRVTNGEIVGMVNTTTHTIVYTAADVGPESSVTLSIDVISGTPVVSVVSPTTGDLLNGTVRVRWNYDGVTWDPARVEIDNGSGWINIVNASIMDKIIEIDTTLLEDCSSASLRIIYGPSISNIVTNLVIDNHPPEVGILYPAYNSTVSTQNGSIEVKWWSKDAAGNVKVSLYISRDNASWQFVGRGAENDSLFISPTVEGCWFVRLVADDGHGFTSEAYLLVNVNLPPVPPSKVRGQPGSKAILVTWDPSTSPDVTMYRVYIAPVADPSNITLAAEVDAKYGSATIAVSPGEYYIYVVAVDSNGLESNASQIISVKVGESDNTTDQKEIPVVPVEYIMTPIIAMVVISSVAVFMRKHRTPVALLDNTNRKDVARKVMRKLRKYGFAVKYIRPTEEMIRHGRNMILFNRDSKEAYVYMDIGDHMLLSKLDVSLAARGYRLVHKKNYSGERWHTGLALKIVNQKTLSRLIEYLQNA